MSNGMYDECTEEIKEYTDWKNKWKNRFYELLEKPSTTFHFLYHIGIFAYVLMALCLSAILTVQNSAHASVLHKVVFGMETSLAVYFTIEFGLRMWCIGVNARYIGWRGRMRYLKRFLVIVDAMILGATVLLLLTSTNDVRFVGSNTVQNLRFFQILRLFHVDRSASTWKIMRKILLLHKTELIAAYYLSFLGLLVMSTSIYLLEYQPPKKSAETGRLEEQPQTFKNYGEALWWGIITLMAVGYGDIVPQYWLSKAVTCVLALLCVSMFTLISSVIGVGLTLMVQERDREIHQMKLKPYAARLIQHFYRARLMNRKFGEIPFYKNNLCQKLFMEQLQTELGKVRQSQKEHMESKHFVHNVKRKMTSLAHHTPHLHAPHFHAPHFHTTKFSSHHHKPGSGTGQNQPSPPTTPPQSSSLYTQKPLSPLVRQSSAGSAMSRLHRSDSDASLTTKRNHLGFERKLSAMESGLNQSMSSLNNFIHEPLQVLRRTSEGHSGIHSAALQWDNSQPLPTHYPIVLQFVWELKWRYAKRKFRRVRHPYDLSDVSDEQNEAEQVQIGKLREVEVHLEQTVGKPGTSLLTKSEQELDVLNRLQLVESKQAQLDKKADLIVELATQVGERVMSLRRMKSNAFKPSNSSLKSSIDIL